MKVTGKATLSGGWWAVEIPEIMRACTYARRLDQVPARVADVVRFITGVPVDDVEVSMEVDLGDPDVLAEARQRVADAARLQQLAFRKARCGVAQLLERGLCVRDVCKILDLSHQCVSQLAAAYDLQASGVAPEARQEESGLVDAPARLRLAER